MAKLSRSCEKVHKVFSCNAGLMPYRLKKAANTLQLTDHDSSLLLNLILFCFIVAQAHLCSVNDSLTPEHSNDHAIHIASGFITGCFACCSKQKRLLSIRHY